MQDIKLNSKSLTASSVIIRLFWFLTLVQFVVSWQLSLFNLASYPSTDYLKWEIQGQRKSIERRIREGGAYWQHIYQPEGMLFVYAFYGYTLLGLSLQDEQNHELRKDVLHQLEFLIPKAEDAFNAFPFSYCEKMAPRGGIIAAGNANLMRAGYVLAGGDKKEIVDGFHRGSEELAKAYAASPQPALLSFPHMEERWAVDNCSAIESLRLHDKIYTTDFFKTAAGRFLKHVESNIDPSSGMTNAGVKTDGSLADVPRGCALSWSLAILPGPMPEFAEKQYELYRRNWFVPVLGMGGLREWWQGQEKYSKIPEGPVVFGVGAAASGLGIVTTKVHRDHDAWLCLCRGLESIGFPSWNVMGEKSYFGELFLLADVIALWGKTACVWDQTHEFNTWADPAQQHWADLRLDAFIIPLVLSVLLCISLLLLSFFMLWKSIKAWRERGLKGTDTAERAWASAQFSVLLVHLLVPTILWTLPLLVMVIMRAVEKWQLMVRGLRTI